MTFDAMALYVNIFTLLPYKVHQASTRYSSSTWAIFPLLPLSFPYWPIFLNNLWENISWYTLKYWHRSCDLLSSRISRKWLVVLVASIFYRQASVYLHVCPLGWVSQVYMFNGLYCLQDKHTHIPPFLTIFIIVNRQFLPCMYAVFFDEILLAWISFK